jgi:periplasmic copper chaperone A
VTARYMWAAIAFALCAAACTPSDPIEITGAWLRPPAPGLQVAAGYFDIVNHGATPLELVGAHSDAAGSIEIHSETHDGDMMQMRQLDSVALPPGQSVSFSPGGMHLMLLQFTGVTSPHIPITLQFSDGSQRVVEFELRTLTGASAP